MVVKGLEQAGVVDVDVRPDIGVASSIWVAAGIAVETATPGTRAEKGPEADTGLEWAISIGAEMGMEAGIVAETSIDTPAGICSGTDIGVVADIGEEKEFVDTAIARAASVGIAGNGKELGFFILCSSWTGRGWGKNGARIGMTAGDTEPET